MKKVVANPIELRDAIRCEKETISIKGGFAQMLQPLATQQNIDVEAMDLPDFVKLALTPAAMKTLSTTYQVALKNGSEGLELAYSKI